MWRHGRASDEEGLRLMLAFFTIDDPAKRRRLIALAESFASGEASELTTNALSVVQDNVQVERSGGGDPFKR
jgi:hypothetical protein